MTDGPVWALGLMSGTSMDGVDAALIRTDGARVAEVGPSAFVPYAAEDVAAAARVMADPGRYRVDPAPEDADVLEAASRAVVRLHARAAAELMAEAEVAPEVVGFPGQTVAHAPEHRWTWQIGDGARLARALNRAVVWDFRSADIAAGGQGAPLAPFYHFALARRAVEGGGPEGPVAFLNIGGVGNVTWVDPAAPGPEAEGALVAFDTGPGNALVNDWMGLRTGARLDRDGAAARAGLAALGPLPDTSAQGGVFATNFVRDWLGRPGPKSLDRNAFNTLTDRLEGYGTEAGAALLTAFTADCVRAALPHLPRPPARWLVCGGGRRNPVLMDLLAERLPAPVAPVDDIGLDGDMLEAQAFAFLAVRVLRGLALSAPGTTGVPRPARGGRVAWPVLVSQTPTGVS